MNKQLLRDLKEYLQALSDWMLANDYDMNLPEGPLDEHDPLDLIERLDMAGTTTLARELLAQQYDADFPRVAKAIRSGLDKSLGVERVLPAIEAALSHPSGEPERREAGDILSDPIAVHANMLRGSIAKPSPRNIWHLYGRELLEAMPEELRASTPPSDGTGEGVTQADRLAAAPIFRTYGAPNYAAICEAGKDTCDKLLVVQTLKNHRLSALRSKPEREPDAEVDREAIYAAVADAIQPGRDLRTNPPYAGDPAADLTNKIIAALTQSGGER